MLHVAKGAPEHFCRLCLSHDNSTVNIFDEKASSGNQDVEHSQQSKTALVQRLFEFLQIKYEKSTTLPNSICQRCLHMVETFTEFREHIQHCENELQKHLQKRATKLAADDQRPGLNGIPGKFEPEEGCIITEVDPMQDYDSSDEDFSMESESEPEADAEVSQTVLSKPAQSLQATASARNGNTSVEHTLLEQTARTADSVATQDTTTYGAAPTALVDSLALEYTKNTFLCQFCDMAFTTQLDCAEHEARHDVAAPYLCNFCPLRTTSRQNLILHIKEAHDSERPFVCALCNKGFCRRSDLKKHTIVHTGVRPFTCPICAKSFSRNTNLTKHMRIHSSIKPHVCQRCPRSFSTASELQRHARSHNETKPFQCTRCTASFTRKDKLQLHEQAHFRRESEFLLNQAKSTGVAATASVVEDQTRQGAGSHMENIVVALNPYGEQESAAQYGTAPATEDQYRHSILAAQLQQRHPATAPVKTHSRLFTCEICAKTFTRERDLQRHQALHLDTLFTCKQCGTGFSRREKLVRHEQEQHSPKFTCDICRITFPKQDALDVHLKMHELQQNVAMTTKAALNAASNNALVASAEMPIVPVAPKPQLAKEMQIPKRPSAADMSFYSQMVPTMNLGFYSETRPEDRNGI